MKRARSSHGLHQSCQTSLLCFWRQQQVVWFLQVFIAVREPSECRYIMVLLHPALCELPDFRRPDEGLNAGANVDKHPPQHDEL